MHHPDPVRDRVARTSDAGGLSIDEDLARIGVDEPIEDVHERGLAGAVFANQGVDLARPDGQVDLVVCDDAGKGLGDIAHLERFRRRRAHSLPGT